MIDPSELLDDPGAAASVLSGLPPLGISAGPSNAQSENHISNTGATGSFGLPSKGWADIAQTAVPFLILGGVVWWAMRR